MPVTAQPSAKAPVIREMGGRMVTRGDDFDEFVRGSSTRLLRTAVLLTDDRSAAEDLVQEVYEGVYVRWRWRA